MRLSVAARLTAGFFGVMALSLGLALYQLDSYRRTMRFLDNVLQMDFLAYHKTMRMVHGRVTLRAMREQVLLGAAIGVGFEGKPVTSADYDRTSAFVLGLMGDLEKLALERRESSQSERRREIWSNIAARSQDMQNMERTIWQSARRMFAAIDARQVVEAARIHASTMREHEMLEEAEEDVQALISSLVVSGRNDVNAAYGQAVQAALLSIVGVMLLTAAVAWTIGISISRPLGRFVSFVRSVGQGDLTVTLPEEGANELARLSAHMNSMSWSLRELALRTRAAAENVNTASAQIRSSAQEQAAAVTQQLAAVEETSATLAEITRSGAQTSQRAQEVEGNAKNAAAASEQGRRAVEATVQVMASIREQVEAAASTVLALSERTQAISDIILTVNTIAERSHLLALNASIEAAAAGEHGRSFAVVAAEIKRMADQAREATARVRGNLGDIQDGIARSAQLAGEAAKRVEAGLRQTEATDHTIRFMADSIQESVQAFQQIVASTNQHQTALEQVQQALGSIRLASGQTAKATRELEDASANLNEQAQNLVAAIRNYRL